VCPALGQDNDCPLLFANKYQLPILATTRRIQTYHIPSGMLEFIGNNEKDLVKHLDLVFLDSVLKFTISIAIFRNIYTFFFYALLL